MVRIAVASLALLFCFASSTVTAQCLYADGNYRLDAKLVALDVKASINCVISNREKYLVVYSRVPNKKMWVICYRKMSNSYLATDFIDEHKSQMRRAFGGYQDLHVEWYPRR